MRLKVLLIFFFFLTLLSTRSFDSRGQTCPGGATPQSITHTSGEQTIIDDRVMTFNIPKFDPSMGTLIRADISSRVTARVYFTIENGYTTPQTYLAKYRRRDSIIGPGLTPPLVFNGTRNYPPFNLDVPDEYYPPDDPLGRGGLPKYNDKGPDYVYVPMNVAINNQVITRNVTDNGVLTGTYTGTGTNSFVYNLTAGMEVTGPGTYRLDVFTSSTIEFTVTYIYCPLMVLPGGDIDLGIRKTDDNVAQIDWSKEVEQDNVQYDVEVSPNGQQFSTVATRNSVTPPGNGPARYSIDYAVPARTDGKLYFRIRQTSPDGAVKYSRTKFLSFDNALSTAFSVFPNPARSQVTIQLAERPQGSLEVQLINTTGQLVETIRVNAASAEFPVRFTREHQPGLYFLKVKNTKTGEETSTRLMLK